MMICQAQEQYNTIVLYSRSGMYSLTQECILSLRNVLSSECILSVRNVFSQECILDRIIPKFLSIMDELDLNNFRELAARLDDRDLTSLHLVSQTINNLLVVLDSDGTFWYERSQRLI